MTADELPKPTPSLFPVRGEQPLVISESLPESTGNPSIDNLINRDRKAHQWALHNRLGL